VDVAETITESGNYGTFDANLDCQFVNVGDKSCMKYSSPTCLAEKYSSLMQQQKPAVSEPVQSVEEPVTSTAPTNVKKPTVEKSDSAALYKSWVVLLFSLVFVSVL
jgi:ABC-type Na+ efflux pump permease subunit